MVSRDVSGRRRHVGHTELVQASAFGCAGPSVTSDEARGTTPHGTDRRLRVARELPGSGARQARRIDRLGVPPAFDSPRSSPASSVSRAASGRSSPSSRRESRAGVRRGHDGAPDARSRPRAGGWRSPTSCRCIPTTGTTTSGCTRPRRSAGSSRASTERSSSTSRSRSAPSSGSTTPLVRDDAGRACGARAVARSRRGRPTDAPLEVDGAVLRARFPVHAGEHRSLRARTRRSVGEAPPCRRRRGVIAARDDDHRRLAVVGREAHRLRGRLPRLAAPQRGRAAGAQLRADRRDRRRADDVAARGDRRRPQLGLPLHVGARRQLHDRRARGERLRLRGVPLLRLLRQRDRRQPRERPGAPDHVRHPRRAVHPRARARAR